MHQGLTPCLSISHNIGGDRKQDSTGSAAVDGRWMMSISDEGRGGIDQIVEERAAWRSHPYVNSVVEGWVGGAEELAPRPVAVTSTYSQQYQPWWRSAPSEVHVVETAERRLEAAGVRGRPRRTSRPALRPYSSRGRPAPIRPPDPTQPCPPPWTHAPLRRPASARWWRRRWRRHSPPTPSRVDVHLVHALAVGGGKEGGGEEEEEATIERKLKWSSMDGNNSEKCEWKKPTEEVQCVNGI